MNLNKVYIPITCLKDKGVKREILTGSHNISRLALLGRFPYSSSISTDVLKVTLLFNDSEFGSGNRRASDL